MFVSGRYHPGIVDYYYCERINISDDHGVATGLCLSYLPVGWVHGIETDNSYN